jgi:hypothetical protein
MTRPFRIAILGVIAGLLGLLNFYPAELNAQTYQTCAEGEMLEQLQVEGSQDVLPAGDGFSAISFSGFNRLTYLNENETLSGFRLTVIVKGKGAIDVFPLLEYYSPGTAVRLTAIAEKGWSFQGWSGASSHSNVVYITMDSDKTVYATFTDWSPVLKYFVIAVGVLAGGYFVWKEVTKKPRGT